MTTTRFCMVCKGLFVKDGGETEAEGDPVARIKALVGDALKSAEAKVAYHKEQVRHWKRQLANMVKLSGFVNGPPKKRPGSKPRSGGPA